MGVTRLKRKDRKNKARANNKVARIKQLLSTPVIKNVDVEELKAQFNPSSDRPAPAPAAANEAPATNQAEEAQEPVAPQTSGAAEEAPESGKETVTTVADEAPGIDEGPKVDGDLETPAQTFVENQMADTSSASSEKDIKSAQQMEDDEKNAEV